MESKWRWNAWYYFLENQMVANLFAHALWLPGNYYLSDIPSGLPGYHRLFYTNPGTDLGFIAGDVPDVEGHPHFPYGNRVEPDSLGR